MGHGVEDMKYRFQWNFPIFFSPHDPKKLYTLSNQVHVSYNGGQSWEHISPDLTTNDKSKMGPSGGPITKDNTSVEYYCTLFAGAESPYEKDVIWVGSDDGLVHVTRDGGKNWSKVTPAGAPEFVMWNSIDPDPFTKGGAYITGTRYKMGDYKPYIYKTEDYGKTWKKITNGIDNEHFTRVTRADPKRKGLLYSGTETGMYISFDDGANWKPFQLNLPIVPITDLAIKDNNLIAATQGRSFWLIDDLTPLHQLNNQIAQSKHHLYKPMDAVRFGGAPGFGRAPKTAGQNHPGGVMVNFYFKEKPAPDTEVKLAFYEADGDLIKEYSTKAKERPDQLVDLKDGGNTFTWNMRYPDIKRFEGMVLWAGRSVAPRAVPGEYKVRLTVGDQMQEATFNIVKDPRVEVSQEDLQAQFDFVWQINQKVSEAHQTIIDIRDIKKQLKAYTEILKDKPEGKEIVEKAQAIDKELSKVEAELYQVQNRSGQDPLNFPIKLTDKLAGVGALSNAGDSRPTQQATEVRTDLTVKVDKELSTYRTIRDTQLPAFNKLVRDKAIEPIVVKTPTRS
jgi:hypothetical protein